jgi:GNAT superfamily N-acetyltransferase
LRDIMKQKAVVRTMRQEDLAAVLDIQSCCHDETKLESNDSFLAKLEASPATCFIALIGETPVGYLVAVPAEGGNPPPLNSPTYSMPPTANALYLHDLAVHSAAQGAGVAVALIEAYFGAVRRSNLPFACLTAVNDSGAFWARYGFRPASLTGPGSMDTYGTGAQHMSMRVI